MPLATTTTSMSGDAALEREATLNRTVIVKPSLRSCVNTSRSEIIHEQEAPPLATHARSCASIPPIHMAKSAKTSTAAQRSRDRRWATELPIRAQPEILVLVKSALVKIRITGSRQNPGLEHSRGAAWLKWFRELHAVWPRVFLGCNTGAAGGTFTFPSGLRKGRRGLTACCEWDETAVGRRCGRGSRS